MAGLFLVVVAIPIVMIAEMTEEMIGETTEETRREATGIVLEAIAMIVTVTPTAVVATVAAAVTIATTDATTKCFVKRILACLFNEDPDALLDIREHPVRSVRRVDDSYGNRFQSRSSLLH